MKINITDIEKLIDKAPEQKVRKCLKALFASHYERPNSDEVIQGTLTLLLLWLTEEPA
jgi:hypothetical protein